MGNHWRCIVYVVSLSFAVWLGQTGCSAANPLAGLEAFEDVLERAVKTSAVVERSHWQTVQAQASLQELEAALRPQLQFSGEHNRQAAGLNPLSALQGWQSDDVLWDSQVAVTVVQQLGANPQLQGGLTQAAIGVNLTEIQEEQALVEVMLDVQQSYWAVLQSHAAWELADLAAADAKARLDVVQDRFQQQTATELDVLRERNAVYQAESQVQQAEAGFNMAAIRLLQLLDLNVETAKDHMSVWASGQRTHLSDDVQLWLPDFDSAWNYALDHRPDLRSLDKQTGIAQARYDAATADRDWTISLSGTYIMDDYVLTGSVDSDRTLMGTLARRWQKESETSGWPFPEPNWDAIDLDEEDLPDWLKEWLNEVGDVDQPADTADSNLWQLGLSVNYRFGDGGASRAEGERLQAAVQEAQSQSRSALQLIYLDVFSSHQQLLQAYRSWVAAVEHRREVHDTYVRFEEMLQRGLLAQRDMEEAELLLKSANLQVLQGVAEFRAQQAQFAAAAGLSGNAVRHGLVHGVWPDF